jgi:hypothetical protein
MVELLQTQELSFAPSVVRADNQLNQWRKRMSRTQAEHDAINEQADRDKALYAATIEQLKNPTKPKVETLDVKNMNDQDYEKARAKALEEQPDLTPVKKLSNVHAVTPVEKKPLPNVRDMSDAEYEYEAGC